MFFKRERSLNITNWSIISDTYRRRAIVVRFLIAGVAPSKPKTGRMRGTCNLHIRGQYPIKCAFCSISPFSFRMALMNWTSHIEASAAAFAVQHQGQTRVEEPDSHVRPRPYQQRDACSSGPQCSLYDRQVPAEAKAQKHPWITDCDYDTSARQASLSGV